MRQVTPVKAPFTVAPQRMNGNAATRTSLAVITLHGMMAAMNAALITGAGRGIGRATAVAGGARGWSMRRKQQGDP